MRGKLISVAGIDGCGKSSLARAIAMRLRSEGKTVVETSAISDNCTPICERIGDILKDPNLPEPLPHDAEMALLVAARVITQVNVIEPALARGDWVVSDRFRTCAFIYQKGRDGNRIDPFTCTARLHDFNIDDKADLEIIIDIDPRVVHKPHEGSINRLEDRPMEEWDQMRLMYKRAAYENTGICMVDGSKEKAAVFDVAWHWVQRLIDQGDLK